MAFADHLAASPPPMKSGPRCSIAVTLDDLDEADRAALLAALADTKNNPGSDLARKMTSYGMPMAGSTIQRHRRGDCSCG